MTIGLQSNSLMIFLKRATPGLFFSIFNTVDSQQHSIKTLPMLGFEPQTSGVGSNRFANCATTTALTD